MTMMVRVVRAKISRLDLHGRWPALGTTMLIGHAGAGETMTIFPPSGFDLAEDRPARGEAVPLAGRFANPFAQLGPLADGIADVVGVEQERSHHLFPRRARSFASLRISAMAVANCSSLAVSPWSASDSTSSIH